MPQKSTNKALGGPRWIIVQRGIFCYPYTKERRCKEMESNDLGDILLMLLDDDLFPQDAEPQEGSERCVD